MSGLFLVMGLAWLAVIVVLGALVMYDGLAFALRSLREDEEE